MKKHTKRLIIINIFIAVYVTLLFILNHLGYKSISSAMLIITLCCGIFTSCYLSIMPVEKNKK